MSTPLSVPASLHWITEVTAADLERVRKLVESTGFFYEHEAEIAVELVQERLARGEASGYYFLMAEADGQLLGYTCYGPIACTVGSFDLYWIAVSPRTQRMGLGKRLVAETEERVRREGGRRLYIETSNRELYQPTRGFYEACGYHREAVLAEFYGPGDDKVIYSKALH